MKKNNLNNFCEKFWEVFCNICTILIILLGVVILFAKLIQWVVA